jgi:hypothetical protein
VKITKQEIKAMAANSLNRMAILMNHAEAKGARDLRSSRDAAKMRRRAERYRKNYQRLHGMAAGF